MTALQSDLLIASLAVETMLHEAAAGPKPGLVDPFTRGAHNDMDLFSFCSSASVLHPFFRDMVLIGRDFSGTDMTELLSRIRPVGIGAEEAMYHFTKGINTHKGLIFSLGILCASAGYLLRSARRSIKIPAEQVCRTAASLCSGIVDRELKNGTAGMTNGEKLYGTMGTTGIRGEAEAGFPSVLETGLPVLKKTSGKWNNRLIDTLLHLMTVVEDSNILARGGTDALKRVRQQAGEAIAAGGVSTDDGMEIVRQMDVDFTERNISPGGCADLLAVTVFLYNLERNTLNFPE